MLFQNKKSLSFLIFGFFFFSQNLLSQNIPPSWGLGYTVTQRKSVQRGYSWYRDQGNSGPSSGFNCGPAVTTMAMTWFNPYYRNLTTEKAREMVRADGSWWKPADIVRFLNTYKIPNRMYSINSDPQIWFKELQRNRILIVNLNMNGMAYNGKSGEHVGKFYQTLWPWWGHFIIVKGYIVVDGKTFFEVYDPYSFGSRYVNGQLKGQDRYYPYAQVVQSTQSWYSNIISVGN